MVSSIETIREKTMVIVFFSGDSCSVCDILKEKIKATIKQFPKIEFLELPIDSYLALAANYSVFSYPTALLFTFGKENLRFGKNVDLADFEKTLHRYYTLIFDEI